MKYRITLAAAALVAALALPATAGANERPSPQSVAKHVRSADQALDMVASLVARNKDAATAIEFARNRRQTQAAERMASALRRGVRGKRGVSQAAAATRSVAALHNENAEVLARIVDEAGGAFQVKIANAIGTELRGREKAVSVLTTLMGKLPEKARPALARAIAALSSDGGDEVASLVQALEGGALPPEAASAVQQALGRALAAINAGVERLNSVLGGVPAQARPNVEQAIQRVSGQLEQVTQMLQGLFGGGAPGSGEALSGLPLPGAMPVPEGLPSPCALARFPCLAAEHYPPKAPQRGSRAIGVGAPRSV